MSHHREYISTNIFTITSASIATTSRPRTKICSEIKVYEANKAVRQIHANGKPRLSPMHPKTDTSSNRTRNRSNHFLDSSRRFFRSMMARINKAHTSHRKIKLHIERTFVGTCNLPIDICRRMCQLRYRPTCSLRDGSFVKSSGSSSSLSGGGSKFRENVICN
jgi:hypothetical protein